MPSERKHPVRVECAKCTHVWAGFYLPMMIDDMARVMGRLTCPMCAAGSKQIRLAGKRAKP